MNNSGDSEPVEGRADKPSDAHDLHLTDDKHSQNVSIGFSTAHRAQLSLSLKSSVVGLTLAVPCRARLKSHFSCEMS